MLLPGSTSWSDTVPVFLAVGILVFVPGLAAGLLLRLRPLAALGLAPLLSTSCLGVTALVAPLVGVRWSIATVVVGVLVLCAVSWGAGVLLTRLNARLAERRPSWAPWLEHREGPRFDSVWWWSLASVVATLLVVLFTIRTEMRTPEALPQGPDTIFHVAAPQWGLQHGTLSSLDVGHFNDPAAPFYPAAFYAFTATASLLTGASVVVCSSVYVLVLGGVVWPLGCIVLALSLLGRRVVVVLATAFLSVAFTSYPYFLMGFGVLWPNLLGQAILPAALACVVGLFRPLGEPSYAVADRLRSAFLLLVALPGLVLAHPNAFISLGVLGGLLVLGRVWGLVAREPSRRRRMRIVAGVLLALAVIAVASVVVRPQFMFATGAPGPERSIRGSIRDLVLFAPRASTPLPMLTAIVAIGVVALFRRHRGARWVVAALVLMLSLYWFNIAVDTTVVRWFTWPWYNNAVRLHAVAILPAVLAGAAGLVAVIDWLTTLAGRRWSRAVAAAGAAALVLGAASVDSGSLVGAHRNLLHRYFHPKAADSWVTAGELKSLRQLSTHLPADAVVAANAWNGGTYLYVVSGRRLLIPTEKGLTAGDRQLLARSLDRVGSDPKVCAAARRQGVSYAITGGQPFSWAGNRVRLYAGIDHVGRSAAWRKVAFAAPFTLYERVGCAPAGGLGGAT